jgi:2,4-diaminopentanoate dehydrogenase
VEDDDLGQSEENRSSQGRSADGEADGDPQVGGRRGGILDRAPLQSIGGLRHATRTLRRSEPSVKSVRLRLSRTGVAFHTVRLKERIRIGIVGLGWVGQEVARAALEDPRVTLVGTADADKNKAGRDLGEIIGEGRLGIPIDQDLETMLKRARPEVAVVCTTSDVEILSDTLETCVAHGAHVVTTCENLADSEQALSQLEDGFDQRARDAGVVVLATGVNPGFAMDRLPVMLAQATRNIRRIRVTRVVNATTRRAQLQAKVGVGMTTQDFSEAIKAGTIGHAGLSSSLRLIAKGIGLHLDKTSEAFSPVIAAEATASVFGPVAVGRVRGVYQVARGFRQGREVVTLELTMALDEPKPRDNIDIVGEPPLHFEGELPGDTCTVATVLSAIGVVVGMPPGLRCVLDVPLEQPEEPSDRGDGSLPSRAATQLPEKGKKKKGKKEAMPKAPPPAPSPKRKSKTKVPKAPKAKVRPKKSAAKKSAAKGTSKAG